MIEILRQQFDAVTGAWSAIGILADGRVDWRVYALLLLATVAAATAHEFGHAWMADRLGDPTPRSQGRVSLSPRAHFDPLGFLLLVVTMMIGLPFGWGKPVRTNPENYTCGPRLGIALVAAAGPLMNLLTAVLIAPFARFVMGGGIGRDDTAVWVLFTLVIVMLINLAQFAFNLIPVFPMDASHIAASALPEPSATAYRDFMKRYGVFLLLFLAYTGALAKFVVPIVIALFRLLLGV